MGWYAVERCDLCGETLNESKVCDLCEAVFEAAPYLHPWIEKVINRSLKVHDRDKKSGARIRPKPTDKEKK